MKAFNNVERLQTRKTNTRKKVDGWDPLSMHLTLSNADQYWRYADVPFPCEGKEIGEVGTQTNFWFTWRKGSNHKVVKETSNT